MLVEIRTRDRQITEAKKHAEEANVAKSDFLATMSHEIRTPMNGVLGMTDLLLHTKLTEQQESFARTVRQSGEALRDIINDVLDFSKIEAGKLVVEEVEFDLWETIEAAVAPFAATAHQKKLELICHVAEDTPRVTIGDPGRLRQVLINLVSNAIKFTSEGEVVVTASTRDLSDGEATILLQVRDTGIGILPEAQGRIFDAFSQADGSTTRRFGGTGLGLTIAQQLSRAMGGDIGLRSSEGEGTTFWFTVRVRVAAVMADARRCERVLEGVRVLLVDDNETNLRILEHQTDAWTMFNKSADDGFKALDLLREAAREGTPFDLVLLDMNMLEMDGLELTKYIKADPSIAGTTLVMLTSTSLGASFNQQAVLQAGVRRCLTKPIRQSNLFNVLVETMGRERKPARAETTEPRSDTQDLGLRILVAEDNVVNMEVARVMLGNLGCQVEVAANGAEAVSRFKLRDFDAVLMDCQMPLVDGYEATRRIRKMESGSSNHVAIIALTANALAGDRDKVLAVGMDDYLAKPYDQQALCDVLIRATGDERRASGAVPAPRRNDPDDDAPAADTRTNRSDGDCIDENILDEIRALQRDGQPNVLKRITETYLSSTEALMVDLDTAVAAGDAVGLAEAAHSLKSSSANVGATQVVALCAELEAMGCATEIDAADVKLTLLARELDVVKARLAAMEAA